MKIKTRISWLSGLLSVLLFGLAGPLHAQLIDFHWGSATQTGTAAFGTSADLWQSSTSANNSTPLTLTDVTGTTTTVQMTWITGTGGYPGDLSDLNTSQYWNPYDAATKALMESYLYSYEYSGLRGSITFTLTGLTPSAPYTLALYGAELYKEGSAYTVTGSTTVTGTTTGQSRQISAGPGVAYCLLDVVASTTGTLTVQTTNSGNYAILNGFQLMARTPATPLNDFLNSMGINTHVDLQHKGQGSLESVYEPLFKYTGIRNDRDDADYSTTAGNLVTMHNNTVQTGSGLPQIPNGVMVCLGGYNYVAQTTASGTLANASALLAIEGPNEPGNFGQSYPANGGPKGGGTALWSGLHYASGTITGSITTAGNYAVTLTGTNSSGLALATLTLTVNSTSNSIPVINSAAEAAATSGAFSYQVLTTPAATSFTAIGLPPGLNINSSGLISGTPTVSSGTYPVGLTATNTSGTSYAVVTITVNANASAPVINSPAAISVLTSAAISYPITASNAPTSYSATSGWVPIAEYQRDLYAFVKGSPTLMNYPVFSVSMPGAETSNLGLQFLTIPSGTGCEMPDGTQYADYANCHNYVQGNVGYPIGDNWPWLAATPTQITGGHWDGMYGEFGHTWLKGYTGYSNTDLLTLPRVTTETGWETGTGADQVSADQQGRVFLNLYLSQFKRGYDYTFLYQMIDAQGGDTDTFGIYTNASTPKAAAVDLHNFTTILADSTDFSPGSLAYWIPAEPATVHDLAMQRSDGTYFLVVWDEHVEGTTSDNVNVVLGGTATTVNVYDPAGVDGGTGTTTPIQTLSNVTTVPLTLSDRPVILTITGLP